MVWTPAPSTAVCSGVLAECVAEADLPPGVFNLVLGPGPEVGDELAANPGTRAVAFTGSTATGLTVARRAAGKAQLLEMGGNGPFVVLDDADLEAAAEAAASVGCFLGAGQSCSAAERLLVHEAVREEFVELLAAEVEREVRLGDPLEDATTMGPLNNEPGAAKMDEHVADAVERGATVVTGGSRADGLPDRPLLAADGARRRPGGLDRGHAGDVRADRADRGHRLARGRDRADQRAVVRPDGGDLHARPGGRHALRGLGAMGLVNINETTNYWEAHLPWGGRARSESGIGRVGGRYPMDTLTELQTVMLPGLIAGADAPEGWQSPRA